MQIGYGGDMLVERRKSKIHWNRQEIEIAIEDLERQRADAHFAKQVEDIDKAIHKLKQELKCLTTRRENHERRKQRRP